MEEKIEIFVEERAAVKLLDGGVQLARDVGDGLSGISFSEHRLENIADLPGGNAAQKSFAEQLIDGGLAAWLAPQDLRAETFPTTLDAHPAQATEFAGDVPAVYSL